MPFRRGLSKNTPSICSPAKPAEARPCWSIHSTRTASPYTWLKKIRELLGDGIPPEEIAVLFRAGFHSFDLEIELNRAGLSFVKVGGFKFMESAHIKDVLAPSQDHRQPLRPGELVPHTEPHRRGGAQNGRHHLQRHGKRQGCPGGHGSARSEAGPDETPGPS